MFFLVAIVQRLIKNVPGYIQDQIEREAVILQKTIWSKESEVSKFFKQLKLTRLLDADSDRPQKRIFKQKDPTEFLQRL